MKRKLVSLLLAALLLCSLLPQISLPARARDAYSGSCGDGLKWRFEAGSGTLTITGNGSMQDYWEPRFAPWYSFRSKITRISLPSGLTGIGTRAFYQCSALKSVTLPTRLFKIGWYAFYGCSGLTDISFPDSVTYIWDYAFANCTGLSQITLPVRLADIGAYAFANCTGLREVTIPAGCTKPINNNTYDGCSALLAFRVASNNGWYSSDENGVLFNKRKTQLVRYPLGKKGSYTVPSSVSEISRWAFCGCEGLTELILPAELSAIGDHALCGCTGLGRIGIPKTVTKIDRYAIGYSLNPEGKEIKSVPGIAVYGYAGTVAESYSKENGVSFVPLDSKSGFGDVKSGSFYYDAMLWALEQGITNGTSRYEFSPGDRCTRGQAVTFLWRAMDKPQPRNTANPFVDTISNSYYYDAMRWAVEKTITNGTDATHFSPNESCTRAQIVTFLWRSVGAPEPSNQNNSFVDIQEGSSYYKAVLWAVEQAITNGTDATHFSPGESCTRAQIVTFLCRMLRK
ncbi:MAG: leucine-rich repeat protein [Oscillospiraceae bacterium]|nr:leucine-rich repeat protein [Oscillospiraceae bacterium]